MTTTSKRRSTARAKAFRLIGCAGVPPLLLRAAVLSLVLGFAALAHAPPLAQLPDSMLAQADGGPAVADPTTQQLLELVRFCGGAFRAGEYFAAAIALIVALTFALRLFGKKLHDFIPDDSPLDKPLFFVFDTKPGGIMLNAFTASGLVLTPALLGGVKMTPVLAGATLLAGVGASQLWGWVKDLLAWWRARKAAAAPAGGAQ